MNTQHTHDTQDTRMTVARQTRQLAPSSAAPRSVIVQSVTVQSCNVQFCIFSHPKQCLSDQCTISLSILSTQKLYEHNP